MADEESSPLLPSSSSSPSQSQSLLTRIKSILNSPHSLQPLEKLLALLSLILLLSTATGFGLFAGESVRHRKQERSGGSTTTTVVGPIKTVLPLPDKPGKNSEVCLTSTCVTVASTVINAMDPSIDPCVDFYQFANGGWLTSNPVPNNLGFFGIAQDIGLRNKQKILKILSTQPALTLPIADQNNLNHLRSFWESCLNENELDKIGLKPFLEIVIVVLEGWRGDDLRLRDGIIGVEGGKLVEQSGEGEEIMKKDGGRWEEGSREERLTRTLAGLHAHAIPTLFEVYSESDVMNDPTTLIIWLKQSGLTLPSKDYYKDLEVIDLYSEVMKNVLGSIYKELKEEMSEKKLKKLVNDVVQFEIDLAKISLDAEHLEDPLTTYNPQSLSSLTSLFPLISFQDYFSSFNPRPKFPDPIIVTSTKYLKDLTKLVKNTEEEVLEGYFLGKVAVEFAPLLGPKEPIRKEIDWLINSLSGIEQGIKPSRTDVCLTSLLENYGFLIGKYYVEVAFTGDSKEYAEEIIVATIQAFKDRLPELDWLDDVTRSKAEKKADAITHKIGYPTTPNTTSAISLSRYYSLNLPISSSDFFGNILRSKAADQMRMWISVGKPLDKGVWDMIPSEVNAYYSPPANEIAFPAGILQSPYFNKDWPDYLAFGAFGSVAGHELSHAFDQSGRLYNEVGKLEDWWTSDTSARFEKLQECLFKQYAAYTVIGPKGELHHVNSHFTNGEDSADAGGISQSFRAWKDRFERDIEGKKFGNWKLPGLDQFTREQLFFIAYAQGWARNIKPAEAVKKIRTDPHSPTNYRVIGPLSNNLEFSTAFNCKVGQPMSNVEKCRVW